LEFCNGIGAVKTRMMIQPEWDFYTQYRHWTDRIGKTILQSACIAYWLAKKIHRYYYHV